MISLNDDSFEILSCLEFFNNFTLNQRFEPEKYRVLNVDIWISNFRVWIRVWVLGFLDFPTSLEGRGVYFLDFDLLELDFLEDIDLHFSYLDFDFRDLRDLLSRSFLVGLENFTWSSAFVALFW